MKKKIFIIALMSCGMLQASFPGEADAKLLAKTAELTLLEGERAALYLSMESAKLVLKGFEQASGLVVDGMRAVLKGLTSLVRIDSMRASVAPREIVGGKLPNLEVQLTLFGKSARISGFTFDFSAPQKTIEDLAKKILEEAKKVVF